MLNSGRFKHDYAYFLLAEGLDKVPAGDAIAEPGEQSDDAFEAAALDQRGNFRLPSPTVDKLGPRTTRD